MGLLLLALSVGIQKMFFSRAAGPGDDLVRPISRASSLLVSGDAASSNDEDDSSSDPTDPHGPRARKRGPATRPHAGAAPDQTVVASARISTARPSRTWSDPPSARANGYSFGGGGAVATQNTIVASAASSATSQVKDVFFGTDKGTVCQPGDRQFILHDVDALYVCVVWTGLAGSYAEQLTFAAPDGHVYQTLTVPFVTAGATAPANGIELEGRRFDVTPAGWGANGETLVIGALPVAGTFISQRALVGLWTVQVGLNGQVIDQDTFELVSQ